MRIIFPAIIFSIFTINLVWAPAKNETKNRQARLEKPMAPKK